MLFIYLAPLFLALAVGGFIADYVFPRIPFIARWIDSLPAFDDEDE